MVDSVAGYILILCALIAFGAWVVKRAEEEREERRREDEYNWETGYYYRRK